MSLIAEFSVSSPQLALYEATTAVPEATVELTNEVATDPERPVLFFWVTCEDVEAFDSAVRADPSVTDVETYTDLGTKRLYRAQLTPEVEVVAYPVWVEAGASRLESTCSQGVWRNRFRLPNREALREIRRLCVEHQVSFSLHGLHQETATGEGGNENGLTDDQVRTLTRAYEAGYYEIPRGATAAEVAEDLGVSQQAVSEQLRRAYATLIETYVLERE